mmetsp:Transcript_20895/g.52911  ORF Transcript_20895/g.52911 Transcript_20895/m.52911 type:complete len:214 (+) Transcript_20895:412-1053(+)
MKATAFGSDPYSRSVALGFSCNRLRSVAPRGSAMPCARTGLLATSLAKLSFAQSPAFNLSIMAFCTSGSSRVLPCPVLFLLSPPFSDSSAADGLNLPIVGMVSSSYSAGNRRLNSAPSALCSLEPDASAARPARKQAALSLERPASLRALARHKYALAQRRSSSSALFASTAAASKLPSLWRAIARLVKRTFSPSNQASLPSALERHLARALE